MDNSKLERRNWEDFFNRISKSLEGKRASVEVAGLDIGDQIEAEKVAFLGIVYDPRDDLVEVALEGLDHMIRNPQEINLAWGDDGLEAISISDNEGHKQIITFSDPLMLPPEKSGKAA